MDRAKAMAWLQKGAAVATLLLIAAACVYYVKVRPDFRSMAAFGYPGIFLVMFLTSATVFLPAPGFLAVLAAGTVWNPLLVGIFAGLGAGTGELSGYLVGMSGETILGLEGNKNWLKAKSIFEKWGLWAIFVLAVIPNPLIDALGLIAGSLRYSVRRFWMACTAGKVLRFIVMAYLAEGATIWWLKH